MVWMQKNADTTNKFTTEKERKKDMKTIYQIKQVYLIDCFHVSIYLRMLLSLIVRCPRDFVK